MDTPPEFEFMTAAGAATSPLLSADELFVNGVILPLHLLHLHPNHKPDPVPKPAAQIPDPTRPRKWKDVFMKKREKEKEPNSSNSNISIWPFSRSRSAGTGAQTRPKPGLARKASSAPCSRSNSAGESKSRKWPASPARVGVHLGRASPVWQARKPRQGNRGKLSGGATKPRVLNLNVPTCIGYRNNAGCRSDEAGNGTRVTNVFNLRTLFSKKVY